MQSASMRRKLLLLLWLGRGWWWLRICKRAVRSTPSQPPAVIVSISSPVLRTTKEKATHRRASGETMSGSYRIWGPVFSHPAPFSHTAAIQTVDWTVTMEMSVEKSSITAAALLQWGRDHPNPNWSRAGITERRVWTNERGGMSGWQLVQPIKVSLTRRLPFHSLLFQWNVFSLMTTQNWRHTTVSDGMSSY